MNSLFFILVAAFSMAAGDSGSVKWTTCPELLKCYIGTVGPYHADDSNILEQNRYNNFVQKYNEFKSCYATKYITCKDLAILYFFQARSNGLSYIASDEGRKDLVASANSSCHTNLEEKKKAKTVLVECSKNFTKFSGSQNTSDIRPHCENFVDCIFTSSSKICGELFATVIKKAVQISIEEICNTKNLKVRDAVYEPIF